jgi:uncharacterized protein (TIGR02231 family)
MFSFLLRPSVHAAGIAAIVLFVAGEARGADIELSGTIDRVTVYPDRAAITRVVDGDLPAGASVIRITGLPGTLIAESLRAVVASGEVQILSLEMRRVIAGDFVIAEERRLTSAIEALQDRRRVHEDKKRTARLEIETLSGIGGRIPVSTNQDVANGSVDPEKLSATLSLVADRLDAAFSRVRDAETAQRAIDKELARLEKELQQVRTGSREMTTAELQVAAPAPSPARIELTYQVQEAGWRPLYTARLATEDGNMELLHRAELRQRSGEIWDGVKLTLATSRPSARPEAPELQTWVVDIWQGEEYRVQKSEELQSLSDAAGTAANAPAAAEPEFPQVAASEFQARYVVPGRVVVPADSAPHAFTIDSREMTVDLALRAVPKVDTQAYLYGKATFDGEAPLLPGPVALFRDGAFVGRTKLKSLSPGETFSLAFGVDEKVRVEHRKLKGERSSNGIIKKDTRYERRYKTTIISYHDQPVTLTLIDQLPVARDERIEVALLDGTTKPDAIDFEDRPGLIAWTAELPPQEPWVVNFGYRLDHPSHERVVGF